MHVLRSNLSGSGTRVIRLHGQLPSVYGIRLASELHVLSTLSIANTGLQEHRGSGNCLFAQGS